ncbi:unnamed protein product, partial [Mesorhabditis belari]|uniref:Major facilitator superfamily (MFS) profile domain-containing protein n=1 Tax=Mesorhabditis belari TaxID=2138241 RepID=A0AAF3J5B9_9BILA
MTTGLARGSSGIKFVRIVPASQKAMERRKLWVFAVTFISYGLYHASRKTLAGVKSSVKKDWLENTTGRPLFDTDGEAKAFLGTLDAIFMGAYAAALFFWGWLGDRLNPKKVVAAGMISSSIMLFLFGYVPKMLDFYSVPWYVVTYIGFGLLQACGWPSEIAIMASWWGGANRGLVMGIWAACQPLGNIVGSIFTAFILPFGYEYTFFFNAAVTFLFAFVVLWGIDSKPPHCLENDVEGRATVSRASSISEEGEPIGILQALFLPGVLAYCLCNACLKLVNYAFFFWLPLYLTENYHWKETEADQLSIWYDVGGIVGSVLGGYISDRMGCRAPTISTMLIMSLGALWIYAQIGPHLFWNGLVMTIVGITISGPYNLIVGSISIDLGSQPALAGNSQAMSTVSGLLDGTGSAGSAIGQVIIPVVQDTIGWHAVFYLFISLNAISVLCIAKRTVLDVKRMFRDRRPEGAPLLLDQDSHED